MSPYRAGIKPPAKPVVLTCSKPEVIDKFNLLADSEGDGAGDFPAVPGGMFVEGDCETDFSGNSESEGV